ncbi:MAG TPA: adenine deaminase [Anaerolineae bacterium]|nr:adenine deaminase [Anaerolineae bacterium]HIQ06687.1 adenine deaminase [Anaerolineae bacterium]
MEDTDHLATIVKVARGDAAADLVLRSARLVNVLSGEIEETDIAIYRAWIAGLGSGYEGKEEVDLDGAYVAPGFIDAHVHIESSMITVPEFASAVLPHGVTTVVTDPHEIANIFGLEGIRYMLATSQNLPLSVFVMAPSCVPATHMATSGAALSPDDIASLLDEPRVLGLAEMMNFPGVVYGDETVIEKISLFRGRPLDGHAPGLTSKALNAYVAAGIGSDHECTTVKEAREKLARGMYILIREATNAHNLHDLLPLVTPGNARRCCFCTDDRQPADLLDQGSIDYLVRLAIQYGLDPITAICMATLNSSEWFGLRDRGAVAPGRRADLIVFDSLDDLHIRRVYSGGTLVAEDGQLRPWPSAPHVAESRTSMNVAWDRLDFRIPAQSHRVRVIGAVENQLITEHLLEEARVENGFAVADVTRDILKMAVVERHKGTGNVGLGFVKHIGLKRGALASTVAHDHHNIVVIGADDMSMITAVRAIAEMGGGMVVANGDQVLARLPLPVAGLMSDQPIDVVRSRSDELLDAAAMLGSRLHDPFMAMSFLALEVIPHLKLTDQGLVDVDQFNFVPLFAEA